MTVAHLTPANIFLSGTISMCMKQTIIIIYFYFFYSTLVLKFFELYALQIFVCVHLKKVMYIWDGMRVSK